VVSDDLKCLLGGFCTEVFIVGDDLSGGVVITVSPSANGFKATAESKRLHFESTTSIGDDGDVIWKSTPKGNASLPQGAT
jgi:hypothetical protein